MPFRSIVGHRSLLELLGRSVERGTLPPSLVFAGPEGVGKRLAAVSLAQALNCERPVDLRPDIRAGVGGAPTVSAASDACGECAACRRIARGVHADVLLVEPGDSGSIRIDQIRDAIDRSAYRPFEGRRRVVMIDEADALVGEAQNALLKTLEEPPSASVFVLITARPDLLLPTVRSRCHQLRFGPLSPADVAEVLIRDHDVAPADAHAAAAASGGSVGRALEENAEDAIEARDAAAKLLQNAAGAADPRRRLEGARTLVGSGDRDEVGRRLLALASLVRDLGMLAVRADERTLANADLRPQLQALLRGFDGDRAVRAFAAVDRALWALDRNASPKIVADWIALNL
ncbi:MAG TPA: DNA polymerase III subunit delta' [Vicinamibacterales bacterium]|jgi:DNA polymerase-3 subunit delta'|nr:DNA polymerase III subunit delta' [Vicinamibacterales bacterium]